VRVLILGGTGEARELAAHSVRNGHDVTSSLAGRVRNPKLPVGPTRIGGFGGVAGLIRYLREDAVDAVVDATHPFAATITAHAVEACAAAAVPLLVLRRPGWTSQRGDDWRRLPDFDAAVAAVSELPEGCVFVTTGRGELEAFAADLVHDFLVRTVEPPCAALPRRMTLLLDRGPYTVPGETALMGRHSVDALVTKDSGGAMTIAKLIAARDRGIPVIMVDRPPLPNSVDAVDAPAAALEWLRRAEL
jgi:precorrin-6A/cobalt-precorrin-6A reductase